MVQCSRCVLNSNVDLATSTTGGSPSTSTEHEAQQTSRSKQLGADLSLLLVTAIWGTTFVIVKEALTILPPFAFLAVRFTLASVLLAMVFHRRLRYLNRRTVTAGVVVGLFLFVGFSTQTLGLAETPASTSAFITGLSVVLVPIVALFWLRTRPGIGALVGVAVAGIGLALLALKDSISMERGEMLLLACAVAFALHIVAVGRFAPSNDPILLTLIQLGAAGVLGWGISLATERPQMNLDPRAIGLLLFMGLVATALVFCIQNAAQRFTSPTHTALIFTMEPVFAAVFAYLWLAESLSGRSLIGAILIVSGMLAAELWHR